MTTVVDLQPATTVVIRPAESTGVVTSTGTNFFAPTETPPPTPTNVTTVRFPFDSTTTFPQILQALPANSLVENMRLLVTSPFDVGALFTFGTSGAPSLFMPAADSTLSAPGEYYVPAATIIPIPDFAIANLTGATHGSATLLYDVVS